MSNLLTDRKSQKRFRDAVRKACGTRGDPPRHCLNEVGERAARLVGRRQVWGGAHLYAMLHIDRYAARHNGERKKYGIHPDLLRAVEMLAGIDAMNGKRPVTVYARGVRSGAVVLGRSRKCGYRKCRVHFVSDRGRRYCSAECGALEAKARRHHAAHMRRRGYILCRVCGKWLKKQSWNHRKCARC